ncbi:uncharacterized protein LOC128961869 [Oppia nitens]|uniref:uncharacterized protein LOC128961869 n=1 Tax=Oppia nitens TaxID=1686743 RepID=UPI0023DA2341|nr:uncharacterized protein LOC128961869 [Oppia nitens]
MDQLDQAIQKWKSRHSDGGNGSLEGLDQLKEQERLLAFTQQMAALNDGIIYAARGPGAAYFNLNSVTTFVRALAENLKSSKALFGYNTPVSGFDLPQCAIACAINSGTEGRFLDEPVCLSYLSYVVSTFKYSFGVYLDYIDPQYYQIIVINNEGCIASYQFMQTINYLNKGYGMDVPIPVPNNLMDGHRIPLDEMEIYTKAYCKALKKTKLPVGDEIISASALTFVHSAHNGSTGKIFNELVTEFGFKRFTFIDTDLIGDSNHIFRTQTATLLSQRVTEFMTDPAIGPNIILVHNSDGTRVLLLEKKPDGQYIEFSDFEVSVLLVWWSLLMYKNQKMYRKHSPSKYRRNQYNFDQPARVTVTYNQFIEPIKEMCSVENQILMQSHSPAMFGEELINLIQRRVQYRQAVSNIKSVENLPENLQNVELPVPLLIALAEYRLMCDPEIIHVWDAVGAALHLSQMAVYLYAFNRITLLQHLDAISAAFPSIHRRRTTRR